MASVKTREWARITTARRIAKGWVRTRNGGGGSWHLVNIPMLIEMIRIHER